MQKAPGSISRAELIGGVLATGALVACGGASSVNAPATSGPLCSASSAAAVDVNALFSDPVFAALDKTALALFDISTELEKLSQGYFAQTAPQVQTTTSIGRIPPGGIVIQTPGTYTLTGNISWTPNDVQCSAIWIACSDVTLDLAGYTITASVSDKAQQMTGILVGSSLFAQSTEISNIRIQNGTVANVPEFGILATGACGLAISKMTIAGICMQNTQLPLSTPAGIEVTSSLDVSISGCTVSDMNVTTDSCAGIFLLKTATASVERCVATSLVNHDGAVQGFSAIQCVDVTTAACRAEYLQSFFNGNTKTSGHTVLGFCPIFCLNLVYADCMAYHLTGSCDDVHGMSVFLDGQVQVTNFQVDTVLDGPAPYNTGAKATGLEVYGVGVTITGCTSSNIRAINPQDLQSTGFSAWGKDISFVDCHASNVTVQDDTHAGCLAEGFGWAPDPRTKYGFATIGAYNVTYDRCTADACAVGFDTWMHQNSTWSNLTITNCATPILDSPEGKTRVLTCDGCSECSPSLSTTVTNIAQNNTLPA